MLSASYLRKEIMTHIQQKEYQSLPCWTLVKIKWNNIYESIYMGVDIGWRLAKMAWPDTIHLLWVILSSLSFLMLLWDQWLIIPSLKKIQSQSHKVYLQVI